MTGYSTKSIHAFKENFDVYFASILIAMGGEKQSASCAWRIDKKSGYAATGS